MIASVRMRAVGHIVSCAACTLAAWAGATAEQSVPPRPWSGSTFVIERDEFTDVVTYKVIIESDRVTGRNGSKGAFVMFKCSDDAKWEPATTSGRERRLTGFTSGIAVFDNVRRTRRSGFVAEYRGEGFDVRTRMRVDDHDVIGPGMWPSVRSADGLINTVAIPNSLAVRLVRQVVQHDAQRLIADTGSGHVHRFDIGSAKPDLRDWLKRCQILVDHDAGLTEREAVNREPEPHALVESLDEFNGEPELSLMVPDAARPTRATLLFSCRAHVEHGYKVLVGVTPSVSGIMPRWEPINQLAERLGESDDQVEYYHNALATYAEIFGTGKTAVVVPVTLRFDSKPSKVLTWWWSKHGVARGAISLIGGGVEVVVDAVIADQVITHIQDSPPFTFDLLTARPKVVEFVSRCEDWWQGTTDLGGG